MRGSVDTEDLDKLEYLVVGQDRTGQAVHLRDVGYLQVGYDLRRGIADLDGAGEVVGGIAIMEQGRNVLAVTNALQQRLTALRPSLPAGIEIVTTYDRSSLIWDTLTNFFRAIGYELLVVILVIAVALRNVRAAVAPVCVLLLGTLFTALPVSGFDQTINLFALAGLAIAIGEMADATIVIVENCTAELARRGKVSAAERMETIIQATATMTRPLLFSMLIIVTSFLPIFFLGAREGRLFNPLAFSKTFAMAFSSLLTLFLLPAIIVWVFKRNIAPRGRPTGEPLRRRLPPRARHDDPAPLCVRRPERCAADWGRGRHDGLSERLHARDGGGLHPLHADDPARTAVEGSRLDPAADGQEAEGVPGGGAGVRQAGPRRYRHRSGAGRNDRDHRDAEAALAVARRDDQGQAHRRNEPGDADRRLRQQLDAADQHAGDDAGHRNPDSGRHQGEGTRCGGGR